MLPIYNHLNAGMPLIRTESYCHIKKKAQSECMLLDSITITRMLRTYTFHGELCMTPFYS